jgi:hypothetical protein
MIRRCWCRRSGIAIWARLVSVTWTFAIEWRRHSAGVVEVQWYERVISGLRKIVWCGEVGTLRICRSRDSDTMLRHLMSLTIFRYVRVVTSRA